MNVCVSASLMSLHFICVHLKSNQIHFHYLWNTLYTCCCLNVCVCVSWLAPRERQNKHVSATQTDEWQLLRAAVRFGGFRLNRVKRFKRGEQQKDRRTEMPSHFCTALSWQKTHFCLLLFVKAPESNKHAVLHSPDRFTIMKRVSSEFHSMKHSLRVY